MEIEEIMCTLNYLSDVIYDHHWSNLTCANEESIEKTCIALDSAIDELKKRLPKKPRETRCALMCANCGHKITEKQCKKLDRHYCKVCGQAIDWGEF